MVMMLLLLVHLLFPQRNERRGFEEGSKEQDKTQMNKDNKKSIRVNIIIFIIIEGP